MTCMSASIAMSDPMLDQENLLTALEKDAWRRYAAAVLNAQIAAEIQTINVETFCHNIAYLADKMLEEDRKRPALES